MSSASPLDALRRHGAVPVVTLTSADDAIPLAQALCEGGLPIIEITFRTSAAREAISRVVSQVPDILVTAGTVTDIDQLRYAFDAGVHFAVSPGLNPELIEHARELGLPYAPGVFTPTEVERALSLGCQILKFFPAVAGAATVAATLAPYRHRGLELIPTGGIDAESAPTYWQQRGVLAVAGSWIAPTRLIEEHDWKGIRQRAASAVRSYQEIREQGEA